MDRMPSILALVPKEDACSMWRVWQPFAELERIGFPAGWAWIQDVRTVGFYATCHAIVMPRIQWTDAGQKQAMRWVDQLHEMGVAVIYEADDDLFSPAIHQRTRTIEDPNDDRTPEECEADRQARLFAVARCDGVTVSSQRLATVARQYTDKPVEVVGNYIDLAWWRKVTDGAERPFSELSIGWAGGIRAEADAAEMAVAWGRIAARFPHVRFVVAGWQLKCISDYVPAERLTRLPWRHLTEYPLSFVGIDIGCCPLEDTRFNHSKTPIKAYEYGAAGAAVVASPTVYGKVIRDGRTGYVAETADEWEDALAQLVVETGHRQAIARRWQQEVERDYSLAGNVWRWVDAWARIIEDFKAGQSRKLVLIGA